MTVTLVCPCGKSFEARPIHVRRGARFCSLECHYKLNRFRTGPEQPAWKGENVSYKTLHAWVARHLTKDACAICGGTNGLQFANKSHEYRRDLADWLVLCFPCHRRFDREQRWIRVTHCPQGHAFTPENCIYEKNTRRCRQCRNARHRRWKAQQRMAQA